MKLLQQALNRFNGLHFQQEYLCVGEDLQPRLQTYLADGDTVVANVTHQHAFLGYCPLIISLSNPTVSGTDFVRLVFMNRFLQPNEKYLKKDAIAWIALKKIGVSHGRPQTAFLYEGLDGGHRFLSRFSQNVISLHNRLFNRKQGNVFLHRNLYRQVQVAYATPRNISLITVGQQSLFNLFPTDLHGQLGEHVYCISLRHAGKACNQVGSNGKLLLSQMDPAMYKSVYSLGKNHMQEPKPAENFPFSGNLSDMLALPIPVSTVGYRELELQHSFNYGIHKLMFFRQLNKKTLCPDRPALAHIHNAFATWRYNNHLPGNYLLR